MEAIQMRKYRDSALVVYFCLLMLLVMVSINDNHVDVINLVYLVVVLCCFCKFILIVNKSKK